MKRYIIWDMKDYEAFVNCEYIPPLKTTKQGTEEQSSPLRKVIKRVSREKKQQDLGPELNSLRLDDIFPIYDATE